MLVRRLRGHTRFLLVASMFASLAARPCFAGGGPTAGFIEEWSDGTDRLWGGGSASYSNPGTGGYLGVGDGYLVVSTLPSGGKLGTFKVGSEYVGDWTAAGIRSVKVWLNDVNTDDDLEIHFSIGSEHTNFWQYNEGFRPPHGAWAQFVVDLTDSTKFTPIFGPTSFELALSNVSRIHFRHDVAPFEQAPDDVLGDVGIDHLELSDETVPTVPMTWARIKKLYR